MSSGVTFGSGGLQRQLGNSRLADSGGCTLIEIEESDLVFLACSAFPPDSQPNSKLSSAVHFCKRNKCNGTGNSEVV